MMFARTVLEEKIIGLVESIKNTYREYFENIDSSINNLRDDAGRTNEKTEEMLAQSEHDKREIEDIALLIERNRISAEENRSKLNEIDGEIDDDRVAIEGNYETYQGLSEMIASLDERLNSYTNMTNNFILPERVEATGVALSGGRVGADFTLNFSRQINLMFRSVVIVTEGMLGYRLSSSSPGVKVKITFYRDSMSEIVKEEEHSAWSWDGPHYNFGTARLSRDLDFYGTYRLRSVIIRFEVINTTNASLIMSDVKIKALY